MKKDTIYSEQIVSPGDFKFDEQVADVFADMIARSVPGYGMILEMTGIITGRYVKPGTMCYDLGCSLGASTITIRHNVPDSSCRIIAVDNSQAMIDRCCENVSRDSSDIEVDCYCQDILDTTIENASLVVMNLTLQFIPPVHRTQLLNKIYRGLVPGGVLILSEKTREPDGPGDHLLTELHHEFKRFQGYSDLEISRKRDALENVLLPETIMEHRKRLEQAGFGQITRWFQCFNFVSLLAFK